MLNISLGDQSNREHFTHFGSNERKLGSSHTRSIDQSFSYNPESMPLNSSMSLKPQPHVPSFQVLSSLARFQTLNQVGEGTYGLVFIFFKIIHDFIAKFTKQLIS